jgi:hypothetical protein
MDIIYDIDYAFFPESSSVDNAHALWTLVNTLVRLNRLYRRLYRGQVPSLYRSGVYYRRVPKGQPDKWLPIPALYKRGWGDCKSLAPARIAEILESGHKAEPVFRYNPRADGALDFHILIQTTANQTGWEDPSKILGMLSDPAA